MVQVCAGSFVFPGMGRLPGATPALSEDIESQAQTAIFEQVTSNNSCMSKLNFYLKFSLCLGSLKPGRSTVADSEFHFARLFPAVTGGLDLILQVFTLRIFSHTNISNSSPGRTIHTHRIIKVGNDL